MTDIYQVSNYTPCQIGLVKGEDGRDGIDGINGVDGKSGKDGKDGLRGLSGSDGKSNYQLALDSGFIGSLDDYLASIRGADGADGEKGEVGDVLFATPFATKALMTASTLVDGDYAMVTDDTVNNGLYVKTAGAWVKSEYDPISELKDYLTASTDRVKLTLENDGLDPINETKNIYDNSKDIDSVLIDGFGSLVYGNPDTSVGFVEVQVGDLLIFDTVLRLTNSFPQFCKTLLGDGIRIPFSSGTLPGRYRVIVPEGFKYVRFNSSRPNYNIQNSLIVNRIRGNILGFNGSTVMDSVARKNNLPLDEVYISPPPSEDLVRPEYIKKGVYINTLSNAITSYGNAELIALPVDAGKKYTLYNADPKPVVFVVGLSPDEFSIGLQITRATIENREGRYFYSFTVPEGMSWAYITTYLTSQDFDIRKSVYIYEDNGEAIDEGANKVVAILGKDIKDVDAHRRLDNVTTSDWGGLKYVSFGDSITWYNGRTFTASHIDSGKPVVGYQSYVIDAFNPTLDNQGESGKALTEICQSHILPYDFADVYITTIMSGANDARKGVPVGTIQPIGSTFATNTYIGALQASIEHIISSNPETIIVLITPIRGWYTEYNTSNVPNKDPNVVGVMSTDYPDAVKEVANLYGLPVCDFYYELGWNDLNKMTYLGDDASKFTAYQLHPNNLGFRKMGEKLVHEIKYL